jgi:hypothetical protein
MVTMFESHSHQRQRRPAMKTLITALSLVFALASGASILALTGHDPAHINQYSAHTTVHQKTVLLY